MKPLIVLVFVAACCMAGCLLDSVPGPVVRSESGARIDSVWVGVGWLPVSGTCGAKGE